jgi:hypothetical protein
MERAGIEHKQRLGVSAAINEDGFLTLIYNIKDAGSSPLSISATNRASVGEVVIPSGIGAVFNLESIDARASLVNRNGDGELHLVIAKQVPQADIDDAEPVSTCRLDHIEQDISTGSGSWQQEQFRLYMNTEDLAELGWAVNETVGISIFRQNETPILCFEGNLSENTKTDYLEKMQKTISETGETQVDGLLYVPNDIVRSLSLVETEFNWVTNGSTLFAIPQS